MKLETRKGKAHVRYMHDGVHVPGVTTVLSVEAKNALVRWANRMGLEGIDTSKYVDALAVIGTLAHHMVECEWRGTEPDVDDYSPNDIRTAEISLLKFYEWQEKREVKPILIEAQLTCPDFGGTCDFYGVVDGCHTLIDIKTSKALWPENITQLAAYRHLLQVHGHEVNQAAILRIGRNEDEGFEWQVYGAKLLDKHMEKFQHLLAIYQLNKELK